MLRFYGTKDRPGHEGDAILPDRFIRKVASIDCTFKDNPGTDMVAFQNWGQTNAGVWLLDLMNQRMDFSDTMDAIKAMWPAWQFGELLVEDKANGSAVVSVLKRGAQNFLLHAIEPDGGKVARANATTPQFNQGRVFLPRWHPLTPLLVSQLLKFPGDTYDDQVDGLTQLINYVAGTGPMRVTTVQWGFGADQGPMPPATPTTGHGERRILEGMPAIPDPDDESFYG